MPRKKKAEIFVDGHGDVQEVVQPIVQYEIDWDKIASDVREAALMVQQPQYEQDDGPLTDNQINQIKASSPKPRRTRKK